MILNALPGIGPIGMNHLLDFFNNDPLEILHASKSELMAVSGIGDKIADSITHHYDHFDPLKEQSVMDQLGIRFIGRECAEYPDNLKKYKDAPIGLYLKGLPIQRKLSLGVIGTRQASVYGLTVAKKMSRDLAEAGIVIISGLARGIDGAAHQGAIEGGGQTFGVLGCGINVIYPPEHLDLHKLIGSQGTLISEYPLNYKANKQSFPRRNRIIAGLSDGLLVVESANRGGSMITAKLGLEYGKSIMAIPGRIDQKGAEGCHSLIREGAVLVSSTREIIEELGYNQQMEFDFDSAPNQEETEDKTNSPQVLSEFEAYIRAFDYGSALNLDQIAEYSNKAISEVSTSVMMMELKGILKKRPDAKYELIPKLK